MNSTLRSLQHISSYHERDGERERGEEREILHPFSPSLSLLLSFLYHHPRAPHHYLFLSLFPTTYPLCIVKYKPLMNVICLLNVQEREEEMRLEYFLYVHTGYKIERERGRGERERERLGTRRESERKPGRIEMK